MKRLGGWRQNDFWVFRFGAWVGVCLLGILFILLISAAIGWTSKSWAYAAPDSFAELAKKASPAVVNISTEWTAAASKAAGEQAQQEQMPFDEFFRRFFGEGEPGFRAMPGRPDPGSGRVHVLGSGFIVSPDGYVVTNNHVVAQAEKIEVKLSNDGTYPARLIGRDEKTDLALLKIDAKGLLPFVTFGNSDSENVGDWIMAVGNPFGLGGTVTVGVVSARGRDIDGGSLVDFLQIDAPINRGNSGGPSFNLKGEVIGVNTAIYSPNGGSIGIGFAIPSNLARKVIAELRAHGSIQRGWLGVRIQTVTPEIAKGFGLDKPRGALVSSIVAGGPAAQGGVKAGDIILNWKDKEIAHVKDLLREVATSPVNKVAKLTVFRDGRMQTLQVTTGTMPSNEKLASAPGAAPKMSPVEVPGTGLSLSNLTPDLRNYYGLDDQVTGVVVVDVKPDSPAAAQGLQEGDVILSVTNRPVHDEHQAATLILESSKKGSATPILLVSRNDERQFIALPMATS